MRIPVNTGSVKVLVSCLTVLRVPAAGDWTSPTEWYNSVASLTITLNNPQVMLSDVVLSNVIKKKGKIFLAPV